MHYAVPRIVERAGLLARLFTDLYSAGPLLHVLRRLSARSHATAAARLAARSAGIPPARVRAFHAFGLRYAWRRRRARSPDETCRVNLWAGDRFGDLVARELPAECRAIYGFNSASQRLFTEAAPTGARLVLEQTIAPREIERALMRAEHERWPGWEPPRRASEALDRFCERERAEWALADRIVCPSPFVADAVRSLSPHGSRCRVVPYGVDAPETSCPGSAAPPRGSRPLRVLFVGAVGLRKGVPYLLEAARRFSASQVVFRLVGPLACRRRALLAAAPPNVELTGPVPRTEVARHYAWADLFCLPSICEGSATVVYEALAAGLPVITTPNAGSIVRDGLEGRIVPVCDAEAIVGALETWRSDPAALRAIARAARERAAFGSLDAYGQRLLSELAEVLTEA
jgi:glycosyltransferase involved in cell wall biosynthesis